MAAAPLRGFLGFVAGSIAVLTFHQGMVEAFNLFGLSTNMPYRMTLVPPFWIPAIVSLSFWGGVYGMVFGLLRPRFTLPLWLCGILLGCTAALIGMFIVAPLNGNAIAFDWSAWPIARSFLINGFWGLGVSVILPLLMPRPLMRADIGRIQPNPAT